MYGCSRTPSPVSAETEPEKLDYPTEKEPLDLEKAIPYNSPVGKPFSKTNGMIRFLITATIGFWIFAYYGGPVELGQEVSPRYGGFVDTGSYSSNSHSPKEVLSVAFPLKPEERYGKLVYTQTLVNHTFDSWGNPSRVNFKPPKQAFTNVVLTLKTTVDGVQYDRLAHLYVGGAEIWRTSTIEPGARNVFSLFKKDVSTYASLFRSKTHVEFELNNVVNEWLTGKFHIELTADFYQSDHHTLEESYEEIKSQYSAFDIRKPADKVYPLNGESGFSQVEALAFLSVLEHVSQDAENSGDLASPESARAKSHPSPIRYLPSQSFLFHLPQVSKNTTRLKLATFVSGNAAEEFWYNNVLDRYKNRFESDGNAFLGHGPTRFLNVFVDGQKIATQAPQPFIFTGGYSPSLWNPVVATNAFDLPSVDIDVTGLLPYLWKSGDHKIEITVDNGLDEVEGDDSGIGQDWIVSANLLTYESADVIESSGKIVHIGERSRGNSLGVSPPYTNTLQQIVNVILQGQLTSEIILKLSSGETLNTTVSTFTKGEISNVQHYSNLGDNGRIVHVGHSSKSFLLTDNLDDGAVIHQTNISLSYPLVISSVQTLVEGGLDLDFRIVNSKLTTLDINGKRVMAEAINQNGTSLFHLRRHGNYGGGLLTTKLKAQISGPKGSYKYKRRVDSADGEISNDVEEYKDIDEEDWETFSREIKQMSKIGCNGKGKHAKYHRKYSGKHQGKHHGEHHEEIMSEGFDEHAKQSKHGKHHVKHHGEHHEEHHEEHHDMHLSEHHRGHHGDEGEHSGEHHSKHQSKCSGHHMDGVSIFEELSEIYQTVSSTFEETALWLLNFSNIFGGFRVGF